MIYVSIVIPIYNVADYLAACLNSVCGQSYKNLEIILIDDGSTDDSGKIADQYARSDTRIKIKHISNGGVSNARNMGIELCSGDYVCFVDADDYLERDAIETRLTALEKLHSDIYMEKNIFFDTEEGCYANVPTGILTQEQALHLLMNFKYPTSIWAGMFSANLLKDNYLSSQIYFWEDFEFQYRIIRRANRILIGEKPVYHYVSRDDSANAMPINERVLSCLLIPDLLKLFVNHDNVLKADYNAMCEKLYRMMYDRFLSQDNEIENKYYQQFQRFSRKHAFNILQVKPNYKDRQRYIFCCFFFKYFVKRYRKTK